MQVTIVEDDPVIARAVSTAVREAGHDCTWLADGAAAIRDEAFLSSDLVVLDLMLPKVGGLDVLRAARNHGVRTPVIVLTARGWPCGPVSCWLSWSPFLRPGVLAWQQFGHMQ